MDSERFEEQLTQLGMRVESKWMDVVEDCIKGGTGRDADVK